MMKLFGFVGLGFRIFFVLFLALGVTKMLEHLPLVSEYASFEAALLILVTQEIFLLLHIFAKMQNKVSDRTDAQDPDALRVFFPDEDGR